MLAPQMFGTAKVAETIADEPEKTRGRNIEVSLQDLTNDFSKSHIKLTFKIVETKGTEAHTVFMGHSLTSDYVKRMSRRHRSKVDGNFIVQTKDGVHMRLKPSALAGKRLQSSQKRAIRQIMQDTMQQGAAAHRFTEFVKLMLDGELGKNAYRDAKQIYPVKRVEVYKSEIREIPKVKAIAEEEAERAAAEAAEEEEAGEPEAETGPETEEPAEAPEKAAAEATEESPEETAEESEEPKQEAEAPADKAACEETPDEGDEEPSPEEEAGEAEPEETETDEPVDEEEPDEPEEANQEEPTEKETD